MFIVEGRSSEVTYLTEGDLGEVLPSMGESAPYGTTTSLILLGGLLQCLLQDWTVFLFVPNTLVNLVPCLIMYPVPYSAMSSSHLDGIQIHRNKALA